MGDRWRGVAKTLALLPVVVVSACTSWRVESAPVPEPITSSPPQREVRLRLKEGGIFVVYDARLVGDSVVGYDRPSSLRTAKSVSIATRDVASVEIKKGDGVKTFFAVVGGVLGALTLVVVAACASLGTAY